MEATIKQTKVRDLNAGMKIQCHDGQFRAIAADDPNVAGLATREAHYTLRNGKVIHDQVRLRLADGTWASVEVTGFVFTSEVK